MDRAFSKLSRKCINRLYWIGSLCLAALFFLLIIIYTYTAQEWLLWVDASIIIGWPLLTVFYIGIVFSRYVDDLMTDYKENKNLLSGGIALFALFSFPFVAFLVLANNKEFAVLKNIFEGLYTLIVAAMPAFIGLLGVQYSVAVQERNRKEDLRLGAKPFLKIECCKVEAIPDEDNPHACHEMKIKVCITNISKNIGIPVKLISCDSSNNESVFAYHPLAKGDSFESEHIVRSEQSYGAMVKVAVIYKDVYGNAYKTSVCFLQHGRYELAETRVLGDEFLMLEETVGKSNN